MTFTDTMTKTTCIPMSKASRELQCTGLKFNNKRNGYSGSMKYHIMYIFLTKQFFSSSPFILLIFVKWRVFVAAPFWLLAVCVLRIYSNIVLQSIRTVRKWMCDIVFMMRWTNLDIKIIFSLLEKKLHIDVLKFWVPHNKIQWSDIRILTNVYVFIRPFFSPSRSLYVCIFMYIFIFNSHWIDGAYFVMPINSIASFFSQPKK